MAAKSRVLSHPNKSDIDRALAAGESYRNIAERFKLSLGVLHRYAHKQFPEQLAQQREIAEIKDASALFKRVYLEMDRLERLERSAEKYLVDPDNPELFTFEPWGRDIDIVYWDRRGETPIKRRITLQSLIDEMRECSRELVEIKIKRKDPIDQFINAIRTVVPYLRMLGESLGVLKDQKEGQGAQTLIVNYIDLRKPFARDS
jgi:hypothetical protein